MRRKLRQFARRTEGLSRRPHLRARVDTDGGGLRCTSPRNRLLIAIDCSLPRHRLLKALAPPKSYRSAPRMSPLVGTPVPEVTNTCSTSETWFTDDPRT
jgi:hypothetical protein